MTVIEVVEKDWYEMSANGGYATVWRCAFGCWHAALGRAGVAMITGGSVVKGGELSAQLRALELLGVA